MKVLLVNGSPHAAGSTYTALHEMEQIFQANGIETELLQIKNQDIRGCIACNACSKLGKCAFSDLVNEAAPKFEEADEMCIRDRVLTGTLPDNTGNGECGLCIYTGNLIHHFLGLDHDLRRAIKVTQNQEAEIFTYSS